MNVGQISMEEVMLFKTIMFDPGTAHFDAVARYDPKTDTFVVGWGGQERLRISAAMPMIEKVNLLRVALKTSC